MSKAEPKFGFDRGKPFYPLVIQYYCLLFGFKELAARGTIAKIITMKGKSTGNQWDDRLISDMVTNLKIPEARFKHLLTEDQNSSELLGPLQLRCKTSKHPIEIDSDMIGLELSENIQYLIDHTMLSAGALLLVAYETTREFHNKKPLWEFLRHCRNAVGHNGRFRLLYGEPSRPALWSGLSIIPDLDNTALFQRGGQPGLLDPGDIIRLLMDIEQAYPDMVVPSYALE